MGCNRVELVTRLDKVTRPDHSEGIDALNRLNTISNYANSVYTQGQFKFEVQHLLKTDV
jgi:hypothetical protein